MDDLVCVAPDEGLELITLNNQSYLFSFSAGKARREANVRLEWIHRGSARTPVLGESH